VLGGLDSVAGAVVGGLVIGVAVTFAAGYRTRSRSSAVA
jgi:branched-subunit amino acid ABC-type transport system permease component